MLAFGAIYSIVQLANALLMSARSWPNDSNPVLEAIRSGRLHGLRAYGAALDLIQVSIQWSCSIAL
jgi:hypothetical protein